MTAEEEASVPKVTFSPDSTPALCQLPALQSLQVQRAQRCHVALLSGLTALTCLVVEGSSLAAGENELNLLVLNRLTKLQDLVLSSMSRASPAAADPRDFAAITASRQLTKLKLSHSLLEPDDLHAVFPAGRHCDKLQHLSLWIDWLEDAEAMSSMVRCCENLQELKIICHGGHEVAAEAAEVWREGLAPLTGLSRLTYLYMSALDVNIAPEVWGAITALSTLRKLEMETLEVKHINGMMQRTALRQLTELQLNIMPMGGDIVDIVVRSKVSPGFSPHLQGKVHGRAGHVGSRRSAQHPAWLVRRVSTDMPTQYTCCVRLYSSRWCYMFAAKPHHICTYFQGTHVVTVNFSECQPHEVLPQWHA